MAGIAWFVRRRAQTTEGYFLGSRAMPGWAVGFSIAGTAISSITFMALPADAYKTAWLRMLPNFVLPLGVLAGSLFFLRIYRDGRTATAWAHGKLSFSDLGPDGALHPTTMRLTLTEKSVSMMLLVGLGHWLTEYACNQNMVQKYCASASTREARRALWIGCAWMLPLWISFQFLGTALWVFFQRHPTPTSTGILAGTVTAERIVPHFVVTQLPAGFKGLVVAGVLAAAMSTLNSALNAIATVGVVDVYRRHVSQRRDDRPYLLVAGTRSWL